MLEDFLNHKFLIHITGAEIEDLKILDDIINIKLADKSLLQNHPDKGGYLHCRKRPDNSFKLTYSQEPIDVFNGYIRMKTVEYAEFIENCSIEFNISQEEIESIVFGK